MKKENKSLLFFQKELKGRNRGCMHVKD